MASRRRARCSNTDLPERQLRPRLPPSPPSSSDQFPRQIPSNTGQFSSEPQQGLRSTPSSPPSSQAYPLSLDSPPSYGRRAPCTTRNVAPSGDISDGVATSSVSSFDYDFGSFFSSSPSMSPPSSWSTLLVSSSDHNDGGDHADSHDFNPSTTDGDSVALMPGEYSSPNLRERLVMNFIDKSNVENVMGNFDCTVCLDTMFPPVYQCTNGHGVCGICKPKLENQCPTCRSQAGFFRCLPFEKLAASFRFHCRYRELGCLETFPYGTLEHEIKCKFGPYKCPFPNSKCRVSGGISVIIDHMISFHKCEERVCPIRLSFRNLQQYMISTYSKPTIYKHMGHHFLLYFLALEKREACYVAFLMYFGEDSIAKSFQYSLKMINNGRKILYEGLTSSIRKGYKTIADSCDGLVINRRSNPLLAVDGNDPLDLVIFGTISRHIISFIL